MGNTITVTQHGCALGRVPTSWWSPGHAGAHLIGRRRWLALALLLGACAGGTSVTPTRLSFTPLPGEAEQDWSQTLTLDAPANTEWSAFSSEPWISVSPKSGQAAPGVQLTVSLLSNPLLGLANGTHEATIAVAFKNAAGTEQYVLVPVTLNLNMARLNALAPRVALAGTPGEVILRGAGFDALATPMVRFGGTPAAHVTRVSPTELRVGFSSLPAGNYPVQVEGARIPGDGRLALAVMEPQSHPAAVIPTPARNTRIAYDAEHEALYVLGIETRSLERYAYDGENKTWSRTATSLPLVNDFALRPDGQGILALSERSLHALDGMSLVETWSRSQPFDPENSGTSLQLGNDGTAYGCGGEFYTFDPLTLRTTSRSEYFTCGVLAAPVTGSRVLLGQRGGSPAPALYFVDTSAGLVQKSRLQRNVNAISLDWTGARAVINGTEVIDADFLVLGTLPSTSRAAALSPDGNRAYTYDFTSSGARLRTFDLTQSPPAPDAYPELGTGLPLTDKPDDTLVVMTVSPDGNTLFIAGDKRVRVQPLPLP